jgi:hypothetical protein
MQTCSTNKGNALAPPPTSQSVLSRMPASVEERAWPTCHLDWHQLPSHQGGSQQPKACRHLRNLFCSRLLALPAVWEQSVGAECGSRAWKQGGEGTQAPEGKRVREGKRGGERPCEKDARTCFVASFADRTGRAGDTPTPCSRRHLNPASTSLAFMATTVRMLFLELDTEPSVA